MSGFRDTFTKDDQKEGLLGYDDTAFYYFASSVLFVIAVPWTCSVFYNFFFPGQAEIENSFPKKNYKTGSVYRYCKTTVMDDKVAEARKKAKSKGSALGWILKFALIGVLWYGLYLIVNHVGSESKDINRFDPFEMLEVDRAASNADIKKAYRKLSLVYHPDKNPDDPLAASRFIQITKAYSALTDEVAKRNWEKYGNPDGPQTTKVGIGLPRFLLEKENHLMILSLFFFLLIFVIPMTFICYYQRTKNYAANGVLIETLQFLGYYIGEATRVKNCPELLAASAESRGMLTRPADNSEMRQLHQAVEEHKKRQFSMPIIVKNHYLIAGHMQRLHSLMSTDLRSDLNEILSFSMRITQAMIEIACMREWFFTAQSMIDFRRSLVQGLDVKPAEMMQIPHFTEDVLKQMNRKQTCSKLNDFVSKERKGLAMLSEQQLLDVEEFCKHVTQLDLKANVEVEDEKEIVVGDVATVSATMTRKNLQEGEAAGPVHAPYFPEAKFEEWWLFLVETTPVTRIISYERIRDTERVVEVKMRFQVSRPGKHSLCLHALSDSYAGIDQKVDLNFNALQEEDVKREIFVHPEDEDLDLQPTLFQQFMGDLGREEDSEEEEEESKPRGKASKAAKGLAEAKAAKAKADSDDDADAKKGKDDDDSSDSDSSDSD